MGLCILYFWNAILGFKSTVPGMIHWDVELQFRCGELQFIVSEARFPTRRDVYVKRIYTCTIRMCICMCICKCVRVCVYVHVCAVGPKTVRVVVPIFIIRTSSYVDTQSYHHRHFITQSSCQHHAISNLCISSYVDRDLQGGYGGGVGWVGGMITFSTTYIMPLYHHHHIITQSSCHHHAISNLRISSYVDRDTRGVGGWVGGIITCTFVCGNGATGTQVSMLHC